MKFESSAKGRGTQSFNSVGTSVQAEAHACEKALGQTLPGACPSFSLTREMRTIYFACVLTDGSPGHVMGSAVRLMWAEVVPTTNCQQAVSSRQQEVPGQLSTSERRPAHVAPAASQITQHSCVCSWVNAQFGRPGLLFPFLHFIIGSVFLKSVRL